MKTATALLLYEPLTPKSYLDQILGQYPYDISPSLAYTLLTEKPYPHPALLTMIDYLRHAQIYLISKQPGQEQRLTDLYTTMSRLSQRNTTVLHTHQFSLDAIFYLQTYPVFRPYVGIQLDRIPFVYEIQIQQTAQIDNPKPLSSPPLQWIEQFPFAKLSIDPSQYIALSLRLTKFHGIVCLPKQAATLIVAIATLYQIEEPPVHYDFLLLYGVQMPELQRSLYHDALNELYVGLCTKSDDTFSIKECNQMIQSLYSAACIQEHDVTLSASMISLHFPQGEFGLLLCGKEESGKCELLEQLLVLSQQEDIPITRIFDHYGTLHLLDERLSATGSQIGAMIPATALTKQRIYDQLSASILIKEQHHTTYFLTPFTTFEESNQFHAVHLILKLNDAPYQKGNEAFTTIEDALQAFLPLSPDVPCTKQTQLEKLWKDVINTIFLNDIPIIDLPTMYPHQRKRRSMKKIAKQILVQIKQWITQQGPPTNT